MVTAPLLQGITLGFAICSTLGPQSLFVLRQGIKREGALRVATICTLSDLLLIATAVVAADAIVMLFPEAMSLGVWGGAVFTLAFGCFSLLAAFQPKTRLIEDAYSARVTKTAFAMCFLNPQVYFEMMALVGGTALQFAPTERTLFAVGVGLISPLWFFGLAAGGSKLSYFFSQPRSQFALDLITGLAMFGLAATMIYGRL